MNRVLPLLRGAVLLLLLCAPALAQTPVPLGGSVGPNPLNVPISYQIAMPDDSGGFRPGIEVDTGVVLPGGSIKIPRDPALCGQILRIVGQLPDGTVLAPIYIVIECP